MRARGMDNDQASSIKVFGAYCEARVYQHDHFHGRESLFYDGSGGLTGKYSFDDYQTRVKFGIADNDVSSIRVIKRQGWTIHLSGCHNSRCTANSYLGLCE